MGWKHRSVITSTIHTIDSHTAGEPTRVIVDGGPDLGPGSVAEQLERFRDGFDGVRSGVVREPRGSNVLVGALLCPPADETCDAGVIFFNNIGYLGMCGHGLIGVVTTLRHLGRLTQTTCRIETPVGTVATQTNPDGSVSFDNVPAYRTAQDVQVVVEGVGAFCGDVAWGGNWFYLVNCPRETCNLSDVSASQALASQLRNQIHLAGFPEVDHVELFTDPTHIDADSRNFVQCPGQEYDRSPCGTGTSAKLACLAADGKLLPGDAWVQEGFLGTRFRAQYRWADEKHDQIIPTITGKAYVTSETKLLFDPQDPFREGIH